MVNILSAQVQIQGVCLTGPPREIDDAVMKEIKGIGGEWVGLMPYAYGPNETGEIVWNADWQWWGESSTGIQELIAMARNNGLKVMLKPHLWLGRGEFTGDFDAGSEDNWKAFERSYQQYILHYAWLAEKHNVEVLCIGTELSFFVEQRTEYWEQLIDMIKATYHGKLTYAANWDEVFRFPLWNELDMVGADAYFPLSGSVRPTIEELTISWSKGYGPRLAQLSDSLKKPIVFTEVGYRSVVRCAEKPWVHGVEGTPDPACQSIAFQAMFEYVADRSWYAGCFIWKWFAFEAHGGRRQSNGYTPQGQPALSVIKDAFKEKIAP